MPDDEVGRLCVWDLTAATIIIARETGFTMEELAQLFSRWEWGHPQLPPGIYLRNTLGFPRWAGVERGTFHN